jgi:LPS export ABC transporter protein LptC
MLFSCREERKIDVLGNINLKAMPTMKTENVYTLISDSGITQYRIKSPLWIVYDEIDTPIWRFPKGLFLEKFDKKFNVISSVACDSATYFKHEQLWRLDGNVEMHNDAKDLFLTQQLYWDQKMRKIYSDSFIHIERSDRIIEGLGFDSNEKLSAYNIKKPTGIFPVENMKKENGARSNVEQPADLPPPTATPEP